MNPADLLAAASGLLSDLDGTLVDSSGPIHRAWDAFAGRHGMDPATVHRFVQGRPADESVALLLPGTDPADEIARLLDAELNDLNGVIALPGAAELLLGPRPVAIVTSGVRALARRRLAAAGLPEPAVLVTFDDVTRGKPDPEPFLLGAARLGIAATDCLVLEDAPAGITAARRAGAKVIAVRTTHSDEELGDADAIVDTLGAL